MLMRIITGLIVAASLIIGNYVAFKADNFDFGSADAELRARWLQAKATGMKRRFKPHFLAKVTAAEVRGKMIVFHYSMADNPDRCTESDFCQELQCRRYLDSGLDRQDVPVRLVYSDEKGRRHGIQQLSDSTCRKFRDEKTH